jgi:hypothetical protein
MKPHAAVSSSAAGQALCQQTNSSAAGLEQVNLLCKYDAGHAKAGNAAQPLMQLTSLSKNSRQNSTLRLSLLQHGHQHLASHHDEQASSGEAGEKRRKGTMAMRLYWRARMRAALCMQVSSERVNHSSTHFTCSFHMRAASPCCNPSSGARPMGTACTCTHLTSYPLLPIPVVRGHACS